MNKILKKITAVFTSAVLLTSAIGMSTTAAFAADDEILEDTYLAAGNEGEIFGTSWDNTNHDNDMTYDAETGTWSINYTVDKAYSKVQVKTVKNEATWIGDKDTNNNITFNLTGAGTFTVTYYPDANYNDGDGYTEVTGDIVELVTGLDIQGIYAVGNGEGNYLNGAAWDPGYAANQMTEIEEGIYQISFEMVPDGFERQIKFAVNGDWTDNFGAPDFEDGETMNDHIGEWMEAKYNSSNITFDTDDICNITVTLDLTAFDYEAKTGAQFKLDIEYPTYLAAGNEGEIFGTGWDPANEDNLMEYDAETGTWSIDYTVDKAYSKVQVKTVKNGTTWIGDKDTNNNITFNLTGAGTFTVTYYPDANYNDGDGYTEVSGDIVEPVTGLDIQGIYAVGNGEGNYLNGAAWDPAYAANQMTEIEEGVYQISFENVPDGFERQIKFAVNGDWTDNFGAPDFEDGETMNDHIGEWMEAKYNSSNITFDTDDICNITVTLDLTGFDYDTKTGAQFKLDIEYPTYLAAGNEGEIFGTGWDPANEDNLMEYDAETGTWSIDYTVDKAYSKVQVKTVKNGTTWIGDMDTNNNVTFNLTGAGTFTVVYHPDTAYNDGDGYTEVVGDIVEPVTGLDIQGIYAVGNGEGNYLNGAAWDPAYAANQMTEIEEGIYQITFTDVPDGFERQIKFAVNGDWTDNFGAPDFEDGETMNDHIGEWMEAKYNSSNITFDTDDVCDITVTLDLTAFDYDTKTGAQFKLDIVYDTVIGDVDGDGEVTINDATDLQRYLSEFIDETDLDLTVADVNGDGKVNIKDVTEIQRMVAGLI